MSVELGINSNNNSISSTIQKEKHPLNPFRDIFTHVFNFSKTSDLARLSLADKFFSRLTQPEIAKRKEEKERMKQIHIAGLYLTESDIELIMESLRNMQ